MDTNTYMRVTIFYIFTVLNCELIHGNSSGKGNKGKVVIAGLFPLSYDVPEGSIGRGVRPAVDLAVDMINNSTTILPDHELEIVASDTKNMYLAFLLSMCFLHVFIKHAVLGQPSGCGVDLDTIVCEGLIPQDVPHGVDTVIVNDMINITGENIYITQDLFAGRNWNSVRRLSLTVLRLTYILAYAFGNTKDLQYLEIHNNLRNIDEDALVGLDNTTVLDVSGCGSLYFSNVISALNGSEKVRNLQNLTFQNINLGQGLSIDRGALTVLATKNISYIDFSNTVISNIDIDAVCDTICVRPLVVKCAKCNFMYFGRPIKTCSQLRLLDISYANIHFQETHFKNHLKIPVGTLIPGFAFFTGAQSFIVNEANYNDKYDIRNISFLLVGSDRVTVRNLSIAGNRIQYFDVKLLNFPKFLQHLNLSSNGMRYLQPKLLFENNSLESLDLSHNNMYQMASSNASDFGHLLHIYNNLQYVDLSDNNLSSIPSHMLIKNTKLQGIHLSHNNLPQVEFSLKGNPHLKNLNLASNKITRLSEMSIATLQERMNENKIFQVDLRNNEIQCDTCACKSFIEWMIHAQNVIVSDGVCVGVKGKTVPLDTHILSELDSLCNKQKRLLIGTIAPTVGVAFLFITVFSIWKVTRRVYRKRTRRTLVQEIRESRHKFRFLAFLAFSGGDEFFVEKYVREPLARHLADMTETNRDLVCTGDRHFQLGCTIADQMDTCCQKCGSVILVISPSFCKSPHCNNEMHIAYVNRKPIILMFAERVEEEDMPPLLRVIFKQFTRVTWKLKDGEYELSTSWENVCESLIDNMDTVGPGFQLIK